MRSCTSFATWQSRLATDPHYGYMRNKDWFVGHSWAAGLFEFGDAPEPRELV